MMERDTGLLLSEVRFRQLLGWYCFILFSGLWGAASAHTEEIEWQPLPSKEGSPGIYEPSAVRQLVDGRLLLVQDESNDPFVLLQLTGDGQVEFQRPTLDPQDRPFWILGQAEPPRGLEDLEGLAAGVDGYLFAITSHSRTKSGKRRKSRERLARLRIEEGQIRDYAVFGKLRKAILKAYPELKAAANSEYAKGREGFNIEGLCSARDKDQLLIGLRSPILFGRSLILVLENPTAVFQNSDAPVFKPEPILLDLDKGGIRAISYVPRLDSFLLVTQRAKKRDTSGKAFRLWIWTGHDGDPARPLQIPGLSLRNTEGITPVRHGGRDYLLLVSDDGNRVKELPGHYLLLPLDALGLPLKPQ